MTVDARRPASGLDVLPDSWTTRTQIFDVLSERALGDEHDRPSAGHRRPGRLHDRHQQSPVCGIVSPAQRRAEPAGPARLAGACDASNAPQATRRATRAARSCRPSPTSASEPRLCTESRSPATIVMKCDKTLCGSGGIQSRSSTTRWPATPPSSRPGLPGKTRSAARDSLRRLRAEQARRVGRHPPLPAVRPGRPRQRRLNVDHAHRRAGPARIAGAASSSGCPAHVTPASVAQQQRPPRSGRRPPGPAASPRRGRRRAAARSPWTARARACSRRAVGAAPSRRIASLPTTTSSSSRRPSVRPASSSTSASTRSVVGTSTPPPAPRRCPGLRRSPATASSTSPAAASTPGLLTQGQGDELLVLHGAGDAAARRAAAARPRRSGPGAPAARPGCRAR